MTIKIRLKELMKEKNVSYRDLARQAFDDEQRAGALHRIASGKTDPRLSMIDRLCGALNCSLEKLLKYKR